MHIKIECQCGHLYALDLELVNGRVGSSITCPACGADCTSVANTILESSLPRPPALFPQAPLPGPASKTNPDSSHSDHAEPASPRGVRVNARTLGLVDRKTAATEARAKILWGDSSETVINYLVLQGYTAAEASDLVKVLLKEQRAVSGIKGVKKIILCTGIICVVVALCVGARELWIALNGLLLGLSDTKWP